MDKYYRMSKSAFLDIHRRQQQSGLTVKTSVLKKDSARPVIIIGAASLA